MKTRRSSEIPCDGGVKFHSKESVMCVRNFRLSLLIAVFSFGISSATQFAYAQAKKPANTPANDISKLKPPAGPLRGPAKNGPPIVMLTTRDPNALEQPLDYSAMVREIVRQSFLIAARDELSLPTRDQTLREQFPRSAQGKAARAPFEILGRIHPIAKGKVTVFTQDGDRYRVVWDRVFPAHRVNYIDHLVKQMEEFSRTEFPKVLKAEGYTGRRPPFRKSAPVSQNVAKLLTQWSFLPQYAAIRQLHTEIRKNGESPELLAALARGYVNLSSLTDRHWSPAHKAYKARALLYAQRLVVKQRSSANSYWVRGYVCGILGRHRWALNNFRTAEKLAKRVKGTKPPEWYAVMKADCVADVEAVQAAAETGEQQALARYLRLLSVEFTNSHNVRLKAAGLVLDASPDCFRAMDMVAANGSLGTKREASHTGVQYFAKNLYDRIAAVPDLSKPVRKLIATGKAADGDLFDEIDARAKLIRQLRAEGLTDRNEPSLSVLAQLIQDVGFLLACRLLEYEKNSLAVNADDSVATLAPLAEGHPFAEWLQCFSSDRAKVIESLKKMIRTVDSTEWVPSEYPMINQVYYKIDAKEFRKLSEAAFLHSDEVFRDKLRNVLKFTNKDAKMRSLQVLHRLSPNHPMTVACLIQHDWKWSAPRVAAWEKKYHNDPDVMSQLGTQYFQQKRFADCERVRKRYVEIGYDKAAYSDLANLYYFLKKYDKWKQTLEEYLTVPAIGLEHARVRMQIARHYMRLKDWQTALPYAAAAAQTGAAWAMLGASECYEGVGDMRSAEAYVRATSQRYRNQSARWYRWCRRTGEGDAKSAAVPARAYYRSLLKTATNRQMEEYAFFLLLENEPNNARPVLQTVYDKLRGPNHAVRLALIDVHNGDAKSAAEILKRGAETKTKLNLSPAYKKAYGQLIAEFRKCLALGKGGKLDFAAIDTLIQEAPIELATEFWSYVGRFLFYRGDRKNAEKYLQLAATSPHAYYFTAMLATMELRNQGIAIGPKRATVRPATPGKK